MNWKLRVLVPALLIAPQAAWALGLGDIRLDSALNQPLSAEIDLVAATPEELSSLQAQLASRDLFQRYGIDRAVYLDSLQFKVGRGKDGRNVLLVRSTTPMAEPFLTFLVEVTWGQGRLLREYTVLLDPPVFEPGEKVAPAPVAAPRTMSAAPAPAPAAAPAPAGPPSMPSAAAPAMTGERPSTYRVERNDTLSGIASRFSGGGRANTHRTMVAMYRGNPEAFGGNMNILRQGAVLRVPSAEDVGAIPAGEAAREIGRQTAEWRGAPAEESGRLKLVTPTEGTGTPGTGTTPAETPAAGTQDAQSRLRRLQEDVEQQKRLLELKNAELANLQKELAAASAAPSTAAGEPVPAEGAAATAAEAAKPAAPPPKPVRKAAPVAEPSVLDRLKDYWLYLLGAAALLIGGGLAFGYSRRRREEETQDTFRTFEVPSEAPVPTETMKLRSLSGAGAAAQPRREGLVVEERTGTADFTAPSVPQTAQARAEARFDDTINTEVATNLDQADPLAEADFHMAYGLYDQAADLVQLALQREPARRDLRLKLLEIFFVWGNKDKFLETARALGATRSEGQAGEWERVVIMGRQIAPGDPLFAGAAVSARDSGVDLNLEGGQGHVDMELLAPPSGDSIDLDLGDALGGSDTTAETGENEVLDIGFEGRAAAGREAPTVEMPTIEVPRAESPTVQTAAIGAQTGDTTHERMLGGGPTGEATAEVPMDELGIDLKELEALASQTTTARDSTTVVRAALEAQEPTRIAIAPHVDDAVGTDLDLNLAGDATSVLPELAGSAGKPVDLDLGELSPELAGLDRGIDLDVGRGRAGGDGESSVTERIALDELPQMSELEPVTLSEVGTKLDLARAYVDMGDPEGARSILNEVLGEGSAAQKAEAQRLLDSLPGA